MWGEDGGPHELVIYSGLDATLPGLKVNLEPMITAIDYNDC